ncbi:hypothetical protein [uncultured Winogradskyella sp.]|uniref:hypothetical protein n=1 Tax=uncultured Winogradskyella sp. TaxID=395353 RepID=UPI0030D85CD0|tara:strand:+ start:8000 stop:8617 length:618 start_codon:yes stop_codon:yes gene_type:complete
MSIINTFKQYRQYAFIRIVKILFRKFGFIYESFYLLNYTIDKDYVSKIYSSYDYLDVMELKKSDVSRLDFIDIKKKKLFTERLNSNNYSCFICIDKERIVYFTWISWKYLNYPIIFDKKDKLVSNQALLEDSYCHPDYRGKGFHSKMNSFRLHEIAKRGKTNVLVLVLKENKPALKVQFKNGFKIIEKITFYKIFNKISIKHYRL